MSTLPQPETAAEPPPEMAIPVLDALRALQPSTLPAHVVVDHVAKKVKISVQEDLTSTASARVSAVTGSYKLEVQVENKPEIGVNL